MQGISNGLTPSDPAVVTRGLTRKFGDFLALQDVNLEVPAGALLGLLGPNGSGKTTMLSILAGFISPTSGSFRLLGLPDHRQALNRTGSLISRPLLWPHLSCCDNLRSILGMFGLDSRPKECRLHVGAGRPWREFGQPQVQPMFYRDETTPGNCHGPGRRPRSAAAGRTDHRPGPGRAWWRFGTWSGHWAGKPDARSLCPATCFTRWN